MAKTMTKPSDRRLTKRAPQTGVLLAGGVLCAIIGVGAAYLLWQAKERRSLELDEDVPVVSSSGLMRIGLLVFSLLRQIGDIAKGE
jgi:hypothetical protein